MASLSVSLSEKIAEAKINFTPEGFCAERDGTVVWVDLIRNSNERPVFKDYLKYDIALLSPKSEDDDRENPILFSEEEIYIGKDNAILAMGYASDEERVVESEGVVVDVDISGSDLTFTIQTNEIFKPKFYSVFLLDKINSAITLAGIFSPKIGKVVYVKAFDEITRGGGIPVEFGKFKGMEDGKPGFGPRSIVITHPNLGQKYSYSLQFVLGKRLCQPHHDSNYNNKRKQPELYQKALETFAGSWQPGGEIPRNFEFTCYKSSGYVATLIE